MKRIEKLKDGSILEIPDVWIECAQIKYEMSFDEYWAEASEVIDKLWEEGKVLTKFGEESTQSYYKEEMIEEDEKEPLTRAWHAKQCIYADLRCCIMAKALEELAKDDDTEPCAVVGIRKDRVAVYKGSEKKEYESIANFLDAEDD